MRVCTTATTTSTTTTTTTTSSSAAAAAAACCSRFPLLCRAGGMLWATAAATARMLYEFGWENSFLCLCLLTRQRAARHVFALFMLFLFFPCTRVSLSDLRQNDRWLYRVTMRKATQ